VDEFKTQELATESFERPPTAPRWTGSPSIALAQQLNEQWLEFLCGRVSGASSELPPFLAQNGHLWCRLDAAARKRIAALPFVIVDLRFKDVAWWNDSTQRVFMTSPNSGPLIDLVLETLLFARQSAREDVSVAKTMFAMTLPVAQLVASLTLSQVMSIAASSTGELRVRSQQDAEFWRELLVAALADDEPALAELRLQAKLLFCGELVSPLAVTP